MVLRRVVTVELTKVNSKGFLVPPSFSSPIEIFNCVIFIEIGNEKSCRESNSLSVCLIEFAVESAWGGNAKITLARV